ncbi:ATP-binding protein [Hymenobacter sp. BT175]|uniref:ATP-binding protein n=1 Tax=Hymenobacter translucens TaxID=2886507 RepID=UPI001D0E7EC6|nr:ATP-binding protein [Hymenobacter translucens]MCC2548422.1 ATP-binding protein [Hymenobacter translucens]
MRDSLRISCNRHNLKVVRDFVTNFLEKYSLLELQVNQIVLAVDEVVANLIIHGNAEDDSKFLTLRVSVIDGLFTIEIEDDSPTSYSPATYREPDLQEFIRQGKKGGVGMTLVNRIMDRVEFTNDDHHNLCRLSKKIG